MRGNWLPDDEDAEYQGTAFMPAEPPPPPSAPGRDHEHEETPSWAAAVIGVAIFISIGVITFAVAAGNSETRVAAGMIVVLAVVGTLVIKVVARDTNNGERSLLLAGLAVKLLCALLRYWLSFTLYNNSDAGGYDDDGRRIAADYLRHGHMPPMKSFVGSNFMRLLTGLLYTPMPPSTMGASILFAFFSFCGYVMFWRAARRVIGAGPDRLYLCLLLFLPSVAYWPASLGKEAVVIFGLGLASLGFARTLTGASLSGGAMMVAGITLVTYVRPHVGVVVVIGIAVATLLRKRQSGQGLGTIVTLALLIPTASFVIGQTGSYFKADITQQADVENSMSEAQRRTAQGGSQFEAQPVSLSNPVQFPYAAMTVIVRPFPWEAPSPQEFATSLESLFIAYLLIKGASRILRRLRRDNPLAIYAFVNVIVFIWLLSNFNNFGILARQRTQIAPFLLLLLALPAPAPKRPRVPPIDKSWEDAPRQYREPSG